MLILVAHRTQCSRKTLIMPCKNLVQRSHGKTPMRMCIRAFLISAIRVVWSKPLHMMAMVPRIATCTAKKTTSVLTLTCQPDILLKRIRKMSDGGRRTVQGWSTLVQYQDP